MDDRACKYPFSLVDSCGNYLLLATHCRLVLYAMDTNQLWERRFDCEIIALRGYSDDCCQRASVATVDKRLFVFGVGVPAASPGCPEWVGRLSKRATCIEFVDAGMVLVADRFGKVSRFRLDVDQTRGQASLVSLPLDLAHLSILTHLILSKDGRSIVTTDRDEKIRVSNYPDAYNIESFCLGHLSFVTSVLEVEGHLVSASADGTVRIWEPSTGNLLHTENIAEPNHDAVVVLASRPRVLTANRIDVGPIVAAFIERGSAIYFYMINVKNEAEPMMQVGHLEVERPISAVFDHEGTLWVVSEHNPFIHCFCPPTFEETSHPDWFPEMAVQLRRNLETAPSAQAVRSFLENHLRQHTLRSISPHNVMESTDRPSKKMRGSTSASATSPGKHQDGASSSGYDGGSMDVEL